MQTCGEGDFMPVEARIEREMADLRRREVELKLQREALGIRYYPVGLAQFTPRPSLSEYSLGEVSNNNFEENISYGNDGGSVCTSVLEYIDVKKEKIIQVINNRIDDEFAGYRSMTRQEGEDVKNNLFLENNKFVDKKKSHDSCGGGKKMNGSVVNILENKKSTSSIADDVQLLSTGACFWRI